MVLAVRGSWGVPLVVVPPNVGGNRRAAPTLADEKACAGVSG
jgi:hypothetical protein